MYLEPEMVQRLFTAIAERFPGADLVFDAVPKWFSDLTLLGLNQTATYRLPPMPWGINRDELEPTLRRWHAGVATVAFLPYRSPRGFGRLFADMADQIPIARHGVPSLVHITIKPAATPSAKAGNISADCWLERTCYQINPNGQTDMNDLNDAIGSAPTLGGFLAAATQNARCGGEIAVATTRVIGRRVALGIAASIDPLSADRAEFSRMVPEKVEAFSGAGMVLLKQSGEAGLQLLHHALDEVMTVAHASMDMAACRNPAALMEAQGSFVRAWFGRATSRWFAMGVDAFEAQSAAMAPIRETVVANAKRLGQ
jgi:hypothetical protein